jgi:hypothetical protein
VVPGSRWPSVTARCMSDTSSSHDCNSYEETGIRTPEPLDGGFAKEFPMSILARSKSYLARVLQNEATKRGAAAAGAGIIMSLILEAVWPTQRG